MFIEAIDDHALVGDVVGGPVGLGEGDPLIVVPPPPDSAMAKCPAVHRPVYLEHPVCLFCKKIKIDRYVLIPANILKDL